jgi:hypothetical protein
MAWRRLLSLLMLDFTRILYLYATEITATVNGNGVCVMRPGTGREKSNTDRGVKPIERQTYTIEEAAKILGICRAVAYRKGVLPVVKIAGRKLVPKRALLRILGE